VAFLYALAVESGLLAHDDRRRVVPSPAAAAWAQATGAAVGRLFETYLNGMLWVGPEGPHRFDKVSRGRTSCGCDEALLSELAALPQGRRPT